MSFLTLVCLLAACAIALTQLAIEQHTALMAFYDAVGCSASICPRFQSNEPCTGTGLSCSGSNVTILYLYNSQLTGTIPSAVGQLSLLRELWLSNNQLTGTIPSTAGQLSLLRQLRLFSNQLTGTIPSTLAQLSSLDLLWLSNNQLTGTILSTVGQLSSLVALILHNNQLSGTIPSTLGQLSSLSSLILHNNQLSGTIPSTLGQLSSLSSLILHNNQLSGTIPSTLGQLSSLGELLLSNNQLTGTIPSTVVQLSLLRELRLGNNHLTGTIPSTLGELSSLSHLDLSNNQLTGTIPVLKSFAYLDLSGNQFTTIDTTTTIIAVVASVAGVLLIGLIVVCAVKRSRKAKASANTPTEMTTTRDAENKSERAERESHYHSAAPLAAHVQSSAQSESRESDSQTEDGQTQTKSSQTKSNQSSASPHNSVSSSAPYHRPPASTSVDLPQAPKTSRKVIKIKTKRKEKQASDSLEHKEKQASGALERKEEQHKEEQRSGSVEQKSIRTTTPPQVLHIPFEKITIGKQLGAGSFGVVYKAKWHGNTVAVKQVKTSTVAGGKAAFAEFEAEVSKMASTAYHGNLVQLHGVTTLESGDMAAVVEYCANGSLVDALYGDGARGDWTVEVLRKIAHGAARGVAHLHRQGVVHRDIAARNVLLTEHDDPKVADFGMARLLDEAAYEQQTMNTVGPLKWMAPEQMDHRAYSKASDVFAFGVLLFEIFQREPPWKGVSLAMTAAKIMMGERMDVSSRKIPPATGKLMVACWAAKRKERPSMDDVQDALREDMASSDDELLSGDERVE